MPDPNDRMEAALDHLVGDREHFRKILSDAPGILKRVCRVAEFRASHGPYKEFHPWQFISECTGHGSGVSKAIYELYRERDDAKD